MHIQDGKTALRQKIGAKLKSISPPQRAADSAKALALLAQQPVWKNAAAVLFYAPLPEELDVWSFVKDALTAGKAVALPRFDPETKQYVAGRIRDLTKDIVNGRFGIREPAGHCAVLPLKQTDLVLVPGVAFDLHGRRVGRGKGFYDRLLAAVQGIPCGVAFDEQIVTEIPVEPHDMRVKFLVTPTRWIEASP